MGGMSIPATGRDHTLVIDRVVDEDTVVAELDGSIMVAVPRTLLPTDAAPDTVLRVRRDARNVEIAIDVDASRQARLRSEALAERLRQRDPGGDIAL